MEKIYVDAKDWDYGKHEATAISKVHGEIRCGTVVSVLKTARNMKRVGMSDTVVYIRLGDIGV